MAEEENEVPVDVIAADPDEEEKPIHIEVPNSLQKTISKIFNHEEFADVIFTFPNYDSQSQNLYAHRAIVAAHSKVFHAMFSSTMIESKKKRIELPEDDYDDFEMMLNFMYTGKITFPLEQAFGLIRLANKYEVSDLMSVSLEYLSKAINPVNCCSIFSLSCQIDGTEKLKEVAMKFIADRFGELLEGTFFADIDCESLQQFLRRDDLSVSSEAVVFNAVIKWLTADLDTRMEHLPELLPCVRFAFMDTEELWTLVYQNRYLQDYPQVYKCLCEALFYKQSSIENIPLANIRKPQRRKSICLTINRGGEISRTANWYHNGASADAIDIVVDKPVTIAGIGLLGGNGEYLVDVELRSGTKILYKTSTEFNSGDTAVQQIFFDKKLRLSPGKRYTAKATISG